MYYVKFEDETIEEAIAGHWETGYDDVDLAIKDTDKSNDEGTAYTVIDKYGKVYYQGFVE